MHPHSKLNQWQLAGRRGLHISLLVLLLLALSAVPLLAQENGYDLSWYSIDSGSQAVSGGGYELHAAVGQPDAGTLSAGPYVLHGGFFRGGNSAGGQDSIYIFLPKVESDGAASSAQSAEDDDPALFLPSIRR
jgi:hypothetical protein